MKEEELVYNYRLGNKGALSSLFYIYETKVKPFYTQYENIFRSNGYDRDDMKGFVRDCVMISLKNYQFGDKSFNTYYSAVAYRSVVTLYRQVEKDVYDKMIDVNVCLSEHDIQERISYHEQQDLQVDLNLVLERVKEIGKKDYLILKYYLEGNTYKQIADKMGIGVKSVCNYMQKIRKKLRK